MGIPQGTVISPVLYNFHVRLPSRSRYYYIVCTQFFYVIGDSPAEMATRLTEAFKIISKLTEANKLKIAPEKCHSTFFSPWMEQTDVDPKVYINGVSVPPAPRPKFLGVVFDLHLSSAPHIEDVCTKSRCLLWLHRLGGSSRRPCS